MPRLKKILSIFVAVWLCLLAVVYTYTWVSHNMTPVVESNGIGTKEPDNASDIVVQITGDKSDNTVYLNSILGVDSFTFRPVSSQNGENFYYKEGNSYKEVPEEIKGNYYIEKEFEVQLDNVYMDSNKSVSVFLSSDSGITYEEEPYKAMRVSLAYSIDEEDGNYIYSDDPIILGNVTDNYQCDAVNGESYLNGSNNVITPTGTQEVTNFKFFDGTSDERSLFKLESGVFDRFDENVDVNLNTNPVKGIKIRVWLEAGDENVSAVSDGKEFDFSLRFDSH